jgi:hypothetical protein
MARGGAGNFAFAIIGGAEGMNETGIEESYTILEVERENITFAGHLYCFLMLMLRLIWKLMNLDSNQFIDIRIYSSRPALKSAPLTPTAA